jgi:hypothetical protein
MKFENSREHGSKVIRDWKKPKNRSIIFIFIKLIGTYKAYAKYMILVAPDFPGETGGCCRKFRDITGTKQGISLPKTIRFFSLKKILPEG